MAQTVIGMFESSSKAQEAVQELVQSGISRDRIDVSGSRGSDSSYSSSSGSSSSGSSSSGSSYSSSGSTDTSDDHESGISKFFKSLFGNDNDDDADKYTRVASQSQSIVTVHAQSRDEAERVADILDDNGAVDVDEQASRMGYGNTGNYSGTGADVTGTGFGTGTGTGLGTATSTGLGVGAGTGTGVTGMGADVTAGDVSGVGTTGGSDYTGTTGTGDYTGTTMGTGTTSDYTGSDLRSETTGDQTRKIPIIEENLAVGKREVNTGGVRLRSRIIERPIEESVRLREERVNVERTAVNRPASEADFSNFQEKEIEMVERAEVPVVSKEARVVEEVSIGKDVEERTETIQDTVRKTEVDVENLDKNDLTGNRSGNSNL